MKSKIIAVMFVAGAFAFGQTQYDEGYINDNGPGYDTTQAGPSYGPPDYNGAPGYDRRAQGYDPYAAPPLCAPGSVWIAGYDGVNGYCAVPPYSGAFWIGPRYYGGRFVAGYWGGPRGFVAGHGFRGSARFVDRGNFRGNAGGGRAFDHVSGNGQNFTRSNSFRGGAAAETRSGGFSRGEGARNSRGGQSGRGHR